MKTTLLLSADATAKLAGAAALKVSGHASVGGKMVAHAANPGDPSVTIKRSRPPASPRR